MPVEAKYQQRLTNAFLSTINCIEMPGQHFFRSSASDRGLNLCSRPQLAPYTRFRCLTRSTALTALEGSVAFGASNPRTHPLLSVRPPAIDPTRQTGRPRAVLHRPRALACAMDGHTWGGGVGGVLFAIWLHRGGSGRWRARTTTRERPPPRPRLRPLRSNRRTTNRWTYRSTRRSTSFLACPCPRFRPRAPEAGIQSRGKGRPRPPLNVVPAAVRRSDSERASETGSRSRSRRTRVRPIGGAYELGVQGRGRVDLSTQGPDKTEGVG